jgi:transposase
MKIKKEQKDNIRKLYLRGVTLRGIANKVGVGIDTIVRHTRDLPKRNKQSQFKSIKEIPFSEIKRLYMREDKPSLQTLSQELNVCHQALGKSVKQYHINAMLIPRHNAMEYPWFRDMIKEKYLSGVSAKDIATSCNCEAKTVYVWIRKLREIGELPLILDIDGGDEVERKHAKTQIAILNEKLFEFCETIAILSKHRQQDYLQKVVPSHNYYRAIRGRNMMISKQLLQAIQFNRFEDKEGDRNQIDLLKTHPDKDVRLALSKNKSLLTFPYGEEVLKKIKT